mmetsp:Transcript_4749/g.16695  ORF Transcript_4749/g.16695 Transcript_4749/m.16695 type:complete len:657 (-) Transcript_4749:1818-3788(-)
MSRTQAIAVDFSQCHRLDEWEVWVNDEDGKVFFYSPSLGTAHARIPREHRGGPGATKKQSGPPTGDTRKFSASMSAAEIKEATGDRTLAASGSGSKRKTSRSPGRKNRSKTASCGGEEADTVEQTSAGAGLQAGGGAGPKRSPRKARSQEVAKQQKEAAEIREKTSRDATQSLLSLTDMRRESAATIAAIEANLATDKFRIWKKKEDALCLLQTRCSPCVEMLISYVPEELPGEWEVHHAIAGLRDVLQGTEFNNVAATKQSGALGIFKKGKTKGTLAHDCLKKAIRVLEQHIKALDKTESKGLCVSGQLLGQIFGPGEAGEAWKQLSAGSRPDSAGPDEWSFSVAFLVAWRVLMRKVPAQHQPRADGWRRALAPLLCDLSVEEFDPSSVRDSHRVTALAFADFALLFSPLESWWEQVERLLLGTPEFLWFPHRSTPGDPNALFSKPRVGLFLFRFSTSKRRRIVLQFISELGMKAAEAHGGQRAAVKWESVPVNVVAGKEGSRQYELFGDHYSTLADVAAAYGEHFKTPVDKSRHCPWFWGDPASPQEVSCAVGSAAPGSFAIVRTKSSRAAFVLYHNGPSSVDDYLLAKDSVGSYMVEIGDRQFSAQTLTELVYKASRQGILSLPVQRPAGGGSLRGRLHSQPTVYFSGQLKAQ